MKTLTHSIISRLRELSEDPFVIYTRVEDVMKEAADLLELLYPYNEDLFPPENVKVHTPLPESASVETGEKATKSRQSSADKGLVAVVWHDLFSSSYLFEKAASSILEFFLIGNIAKGGKIAIKFVKVLLLCSLVCSPCLGNMVPLERTQHTSVVNVCREDIGVADSKIVLSDQCGISDLPDINLHKGHIQLSHQQRPQIILGGISPLSVSDPQGGGTGDTSTNYSTSQINEKIDKNYEIRDATIRSLGMLIGMPLGMLLVLAAIEVPYYWKAWKKAQAWKERKRHGE